MAGITKAQAEAQLASWLAADTAVSTGQEWTQGGVTFTRADAAQIRINIKFWNSEVKRLTRGGISIMGATFAE